MGRRAIVSKEDAVAVIRNFIEHFKTHILPDHSSPVWQEMSDWLIAKNQSNKWTKHNIYINVRENRKQILSLAREQENIQIPSQPLDVSFNDSTIREPSLENDGPDDDYVLEKETGGLKQYTIIISMKEWMEMRGTLDKTPRDKNRAGFVKDVWEYIFSEAVYLQCNSSCAYTFHSCAVYERGDRLHFLRIAGTCKGKKCKNPFFAYLYRAE